MTPPDGPWLLTLTVLRSSALLSVMGLSLALGATLGLTGVLGAHPGEGILVRLPLGLIPFILLARMGDHAGGRVAAIALALGVSLFLLGSWPQGGRSGRIELGATSVEGYEQTIAGRSVPTHLGGQLSGRVSDESLLLEVGTAGVVKMTAEVPITHRSEVALGTYRVRSEGTGKSPNIDTAVVTLTPRTGEGPAITIQAPLNKAIAIGEQGRITTRAIRGDYLGIVGAAAELDIVWGDGQEVSWHFVDAPDLDVRLGTSPWTVKLERLEMAQVHKLGIRTAGLDVAAWIGFVLIALGLVVALIRRERLA